MTWFSLIQKAKQFQKVSAIASSFAVLTIAINFTGIYQTYEWSISDRWFQIRPKTKDSGILKGEITKSDISKLGKWSFPDGVLIQLLSTIKEQKPKAIGLDIYGDINYGKVLPENIPKVLFRDRLALINTTVLSLNNFFSTPYNGNGSSQMPEVYIHANIASQLIAGALNEKTMLRGISERSEWLWILGWSVVGSCLSLILFNKDLLPNNPLNSIKLAVISIFVPICVILSSSYVLFIFGWWLPAFAPVLASVIASMGVTTYYDRDRKRIAFTDGLTKIANRHFFNRYIEQQWSKSRREKRDLAVILCDIDFFRIYNDIYGHQEGDVCLQKVALALHSSIRSVDFVARYSGEEFVVVLPDSNAETAILVANRIRSKLIKMQILHEGSEASRYVSISMGIASLYNNKVISIEELLAVTNKALERAKQQGGDRAVVYQPEGE